MPGMRLRRILIAAACLTFVAGLAAEPIAAPQLAAASPRTVRIAAVGDMVCSAPPNRGSDPTATDRRYIRGFCQYGKVSNLVVKGNYDRFLTLGDLQYYFGALGAFRRYYDPTYGRVMSITAPSPGNHESYTSDARGNPYAGYRAYFGKRAHWNLRGGSYSFDLGAWHIVSLNSQWCQGYTWVFHNGHWRTVPAWGSGSPWGCHKGDPLYDWFVRDLQRHDNACTLMYFHHPSYFGVGNGWPGGSDSLVHGVYSFTRPLYRVFYRHGGDVVLNGHEHYYQRTKPIDPAGKGDPAHGFTEFIVGTGGDTLQPMPPLRRLPKQLAAASNRAFGILSMTLKPHGYGWRFVPAAGSPGRWVYSARRGYTIFKNGNGTAPVDSGTGTCHGLP
jgi:hypothetical protein